MRILLVVATEKELDGLMRLNSSSYDLHPPHEIQTLVSGVGMVATAFLLGRTLATFKPDLAMNVGIAGSFRRDIPLGEVVNVVEDCFTEMGAQDGEKFLTSPQIALSGANDFPFRDGRLQAVYPGNIPAVEQLRKVSGITVNTVHGEESAIERVTELFHPDVESMEGAAFLYACRMEGLPCLQIRAISNYVERRNRESWNIPLALEKLAEKMKEILDDLN